MNCFRETQLTLQESRDKCTDFYFYLESHKNPRTIDDMVNAMTGLLYGIVLQPDPKPLIDLCLSPKPFLIPDTVPILLLLYLHVHVHVPVFVPASVRGCVIESMSATGFLFLLDPVPVFLRLFLLLS